jgi:hypothetical protein
MYPVNLMRLLATDGKSYLGRTYEKISKYPHIIAKIATCNLVVLPKKYGNGASFNNHFRFALSKPLHAESITPPTRCDGPPIRQPRRVTQTTAIPSRTPHMMKEYFIDKSCET